MGKIILRGVLAGIAVCIAMMAVGFLCGAVFPGLEKSYENYNLFRSMEDWHANMFWLYPIVIGIGLSWLWSRVRLSFQPGQGLMSRVFGFSILYFISAVLPGMIVTYSSFQVTKYHFIAWSLSSFAGSVAGAIVIALMDKDKPAVVS